MRISASRQRNAVSQGMALGLLMRDRGRLPVDKVVVDLVFESVWRTWDHRHEFPQVSTDLRNGLDGYIAITHADERKSVWHLYWDSSTWPPQIHARERWRGVDIDPDEVAQGIDGSVPATAWAALAHAFLERAEPENEASAVE